jgi:hypothetical protein
LRNDNSAAWTSIGEMTGGKMKLKTEQQPAFLDCRLVFVSGD